MAGAAQIARAASANSKKYFARKLKCSFEEKTRGGKCKRSSVEDSSEELVCKSVTPCKFQVTGVAIFRGGLKKGNSLTLARTL